MCIYLEQKKNSTAVESSKSNQMAKFRVNYDLL